MGARYSPPMPVPTVGTRPQIERISVITRPAAAYLKKRDQAHADRNSSRANSNYLISHRGFAAKHSECG